MCRYAIHGIGGARYLGRSGKFPWPGTLDVISTSGVSPGRSPCRIALKICLSLNRPIPVALSGVRFRGRVLKGPIWNSWSAVRTPASHPSAAGVGTPPLWQSPQPCSMTRYRPRAICASVPCPTDIVELLDTDGVGAVQAATKSMAGKTMRCRDSSFDRDVTSYSPLSVSYLTSRTPIMPWSS
jgi:hypothetical protein